MRKKHVTLTVLLFILTLWGTAQSKQNNTLPPHLHRCPSHAILNEQLSQDAAFAQRRADIERHAVRFQQNQVQQRQRIQIPVVVHVVYNSALDNISDDQVRSQIVALNRDFNQTNADVSQVPLMFQPFVANCGIEFRLAERDPQGYPANAIRHIKSARPLWKASDDVKFTAKSGDDAWDATRYLNIWVCVLENGIIGAAQFPGAAAAVDGIIIDYRCFGTIGTVERPYHLGRTCVHEVSHWLNNFHLWGDAECGDDHVADTPPQKNETTGKNGFPKYDACADKRTIRMSMNFLDYADDDQMYFFTQGQKQRMLALFGAGGARESLLSSDGCQPVTSLQCQQINTPTVFNIASDKADVQWLPIDGAKTYKVAFSINSTGVWLSQNASENQVTLRGLLPQTAYRVRVLGDCPSAVWSYEQPFFTSKAKIVDCHTDFLNNDKPLLAAELSLNTTVHSVISKPNQSNWFAIRTTREQPNFKIVASSLPADYDLRLYSSGLTLLQTSTKENLEDEQVSFNATIEGRYFVQLSGYHKAFDPENCYALTVNASANPFQNFSRLGKQINLDRDDFCIYPNPTSDEVTLTVENATDGVSLIRIFGINGGIYNQLQHQFTKSQPSLTLDVSDLSNGVYSIIIVTDGSAKNKKFVVQK